MGKFSKIKKIARRAKVENVPLETQPKTVTIREKARNRRRQKFPHEPAREADF